MGQRLTNATALYLDAIRDGNAEEAITRYAGNRYTQHSTPVRDGPAGFIEFFKDFHRRNPIRDIEILRGFEDGPYVFLHVLQTLNNGEFRYVTADIFETDDDAKMIEHWDMIAEVTDDTLSGHSQIEGPTEPSDPEKTEENKALVRSFLTDVFVNGDLDALEQYVSSDSHVQHSVNIGDGLAGLRDHLTGADGRGDSVRYLKIHRVIGSGSLVAAMSHAHIHGADVAVIDLFRVSGGRIVEHWDVTEVITPEETWVNSGKF